jgi:3-hydroxy-3-methylglutaryl CoA synthase
VLTFHPQCVDQAELEKFDGVSQGKYTIGLGQTKMSFCDDREGKAIAPSVARRV